MPDMTLDKIRDEIARHKGWRNDISGWGFGPGGWVKPHHDENGEIVSTSHCVNGDHPVPASLDWAAQQWPKERPLFVQFTLVNEGEPRTWSASSFSEREAEHPTELHARLALLLAVLEAEAT